MEEFMKTQVLTGSKAEIAEQMTHIEGTIREVIVVIDEPIPAPPAEEDMFAEMEPYMVNVAEFDDSREAIYTRMEGE
jgi:hypothetical protein